MQTSQNKISKTQTEIVFELSKEEFMSYFNDVLQDFKKQLRVDGFRNESIPDKIVEEKIGIQKLLMEAGERAIKQTYLNYIFLNRIEPIGKPEARILKLAKDNPFVFSVKIFILPEINLPDYKEIAKNLKKKEISVSSQEVEDALIYLQKSRAKFIAKNGPAQKKDFVEISYQNKYLNQGKEIEDKFILGEGGFIEGFEENIIGMEPNQEKNFEILVEKDAFFLKKIGLEWHEGLKLEFKLKLKSIYKMEIPVLNDQFARSVGNFNSLKDLKESIREGLLIEKEEAERERRREEIIQCIIENSSFEVPEPMIEFEKEKLLEIFKTNLEKELKMSLEDYLSTTKQSEEQFKETYRKEAERNIRKMLVLKEIGKRENIEVTEEEIEKEINELIKNFSIDYVKKFDIKRLKEYTKDIIYNEKVFQFLENLSQ